MKESSVCLNKKGKVIHMEQEIVIGSYEGEPVVYETTEADGAILSALIKLLAGTLISCGIKALLKLMSSNEFKMKYPGGKLKMGYNLIEKMLEEGSDGFDLNLSLENKLEEA